MAGVGDEIDAHALRPARPADWSTSRTGVLPCSIGRTVRVHGRSVEPSPTNSRSAKSSDRIAQRLRVADGDADIGVFDPLAEQVARRALAASVRDPSTIRAGSSRTPISERARSISGITAPSSPAWRPASRAGLAFAARALAAPGADDDDEEDRIDPEARGSGIGVRHEIKLNRLEEMPISVVS